MRGPMNVKMNIIRYFFLKYRHYADWMHIIILETKKTNPLQIWTGPEGSRRLRLPGFKTIDT